MKIRSILALALTCAFGLSACSKTGGGPSGAGGHNPWTQHGVLRVGNVDEPDSLNPLFAHTDSTDQVAGLIYAGLLRYDDNGNFIPDLATAVPTYQNGGISKDGKTITFHLRHNAKWSDGAPLTANDWLFTYHSVLNPANNTKTRYGWDEIASALAPDPYTLVVHFKVVDGSILGLFGSAGGAAYPPLPAHLLAKLPDLNRVPFNAHPISSGPFVLQQWNHGSSLVFTANPYYFRGVPKLEKIIWKVIPNVNTLFEQLQTHEVDVYVGVDENHIPSLANVRGIVVTKKLIANWRHMGINTSRPQLHDPRVRLALIELIDWKRINDTVYHGYNQLAVSDVYPTLWAAPTITPYPYDPQGAKKSARSGRMVDGSGRRAPQGVAGDAHHDFDEYGKARESAGGSADTKPVCVRTESTYRYATIRRACSSRKADRSTKVSTIWSGASKRTGPIPTTAGSGAASSFRRTARTRRG